MVRKLACKLLSLLLILPSAAFALGMGDIRLHSALNQPLNADIELLSVPETEADSIQVALASYETFAKVGVDRPAVLMFLKFDVVQRNGRHYIHVYSKDPIKEPFLDFLVEVSWRSGRMLREYTMLIDPPGMTAEAAPAIEAPTMATPAAATPTVTAAPDAAAPTAVMTTPTAARGGLRYGPVKADDTLWAIAREMRPNKSVSVQQMMMALLKANPEAFYDNNVNRLKKGFVLRLDDPSVINAISHAEAVRAISAQNRAWQDYVQQAGAGAAERPSTETSAQAARAVAAPEEPRLKLVAPEGTAAEGAGTSAKVDGASSEKLRQELMLAQETAEAQQRENTELRKRMQELEGQLASMQRLLSLKDSDLASLQQQMGNVPAPAESAPVESAPVDSAPAATEAKPEAVVTAPAQESVAATEQPATETAATAASEETAEKAAAAEEPAPTTEAAPAAEAPKPLRRQAPPPAPVETSLLDDLMADPMMMAGAGGVAIALLLLLALVMKRRRAGGPGFSESILTAGGTSILNSKTTAGAPSSEESSLFSDLAVSGMNSLQGADSEVDPLTEADVYMAYGRYQQAEDLLKEALKNHDERHDLKVKLLEVYFATKDRPAFEGLANEVFTALEGNGPLWGKVLVMGHELCPDNPMFSQAPESGLALAAEGGAAAGNDVLDIGIDLDALTQDMESSAESGTPFNLDLGVDFSELEEEAGKPAAKAAPASAPVDLNFDLPEEPAAEAPAEIDLSDLDFGAPEEQAAEPAAAPAEASKDSGLEFDLGDFSFGEEKPAAQEKGASAKGGSSLDFDLGDLNLDLGESSGAAEESAAGLGDLGMGDLDLGDMDAVGTKLDLARAYVDMGEPDSARSILDEVMQEGNNEQKRQAQELLGQLA